MESLEKSGQIATNIQHRVSFFTENYIECQCGLCFTSLVDYGLHTRYYVKAIDSRTGTEFIRAKGAFRRKGGRPKGVKNRKK